MALARELWRGEYSETDFPSLPCPSCATGHVSIVPETLVVKEPDWSTEQHSHDAWDPDWISQRFVAILKCSHKSCGDIVAVSGTAHYTEIMEDDHQLKYIRILVPQGMSPAPQIILIPTETPNQVEMDLRKSFQLYWSDLSASANRLRISVEALLTHLKIPRYTRIAGELVPLSLNNRIDKFKTKDVELKDTLHALRMVGNVGSHDSDILTREALLDGFEIYEDALANLYGKRAARMKAIRKKIKKTKGKYAGKRKKKGILSMFS